MWYDQSHQNIHQWGAMQCDAHFQKIINAYEIIDIYKESLLESRKYIDKDIYVEI